jgi:hypothetical protein
MGYKSAEKPASSIERGNPKVDGKPYDPESTDLPLIPPSKDWSKEQLDARLQRHADAIEKATADARTSSIESDVTGDLGDLSKFGF